MFIAPVLIIVFSLIISYLLYYKKKPFRFYIGNIVASIVVLVFYIYSKGIVSDLEIKIVDVRVLKAISDVGVALFFTQFALTVFNFVRATGFDIEQFNFDQDLKQIAIEEKDNEEVEIQLDIDTDRGKRHVRRFFRYARYYYLENKLIANTIIILIIGIVTFNTYMDVNVYNKDYSTNAYFNIVDFNMKINNVYVTNEDNKGNIITDEDTSLVIIDISVKSKYSETILETGKTSLRLDGLGYYPVIFYRDNLNDLGTTYEDTKVSLEYEDYILTYEVPTINLNKSMEFNYVESSRYINGEINPNIIHIDLTYDDLDINLDEKEYTLGDTINFDDSIIEGSLLIDSYEISDTFINNYALTILDTKYLSKEYIKPKVNGNYDKVLLKVSVDSTLDFENLVSLYATVEYKIGNTIKTQKTGLSFVKTNHASNSDEYYIEVIDEVINAYSINLEFIIRNKTYSYNLK
jgi:hypothetical protein